jgi:hypothetical protein
MVAIVFFVLTALIKFYQSMLWNQYRMLAMLILVPIGLMYWAVLEFSRTAKIGLGPTMVESRAPNTCDRADG